MLWAAKWDVKRRGAVSREEGEERSRPEDCSPLRGRGPVAVIPDKAKEKRDRFGIVIGIIAEGRYEIIPAESSRDAIISDT